MQILGWIVFGITCIIALAQLPLLKEEARGVKILAIRFFVLLLIGIIVTIFTSISKLNLFWWIPLTYLGNIYLFKYAHSKSVKAKYKTK